MKIFRLAFCGLCLANVLSACADRFDLPYRDETEHFVIFMREGLERCEGAKEWLEHQYSVLADFFGIEPAPQILIYVFRDADDMLLSRMRFERGSTHPNRPLETRSE